uniref:Uncharacterized protein n=1 Tax=Aegilops tauschii TaxID=37682 RepID=M8BL15_AEGTA
MDGAVLDMMEDDEPLAHALTATATASAPTIFHHKVSTVSRGKSSEPPFKFSKEQDTTTATAAPMEMDVETEAQQQQPCRMLNSFQVSSDFREAL